MNAFVRAAESPRYALFIILLTGFLWASPFLSKPALGADNIDDSSPAELRLYRLLADASRLAYDDARSDLETTPSGCVALVREDGGGNLVIAFRGSMLADRNPRHGLSSFGGANIKRAYRDWVATNLKQTTGFLPRQYVEAAALVEKHVRSHPADKRVYVTGHSKGGGAATYAFVSAWLAPEISVRQMQRVRCVTFNAAVVREQNWRRLFRGRGREAVAVEREPGAGSVDALVMRDDPVSKIGVSEERRYARRITITPTSSLSATEQHGIEVILEELGKRLERIGK